MIRVLDVVAQQRWLDRIGDLLQQGISAAFESLGTDTRAVKNLLHGTWVGHPLHPILTDVAIGGWTTAVAPDLLDQVADDELTASGADAALGLGLLGAVGSAITGANDWQHTDGKPRRLGVAHAVLNATATALFTTSLIARLAGSRSSGRWLAWLGLGVSTGAAYIGGDLVFGEQIGVNHAAGQSIPDDYTAALPHAEMHEDEPHLAKVGGTRVVLVRHGGRIHALAETCSHLGGPLAEGTLGNGGIICPWHGSRFNLEDGSVLDGPATFPQPCFDVRVQDGQIEVRQAPS